MGDISNDDVEFLNAFFSEEELSDEGLKELDERLKNPDFKKYYNKRLDEKYTTSPLKLFVAYLPLLLLIVLAFIGIYLIIMKM